MFAKLLKNKQLDVTEWKFDKLRQSYTLVSVILNKFVILTNTETHVYGIKVRLQDGKVGRVQSIG
ncbi:DUF2196 domain-containing protein [Bacillus pseudomycoides]|nr:hypothetical protein bpmyx0001_42530 [Bacillus pseudomycoides DSM 12442]OOR52755.1 hypothetical protein BLX05_09960 [Bacillus pseudomycoides]PDY01161.1 DUF2196 domain-containing protein [Bacillus pseudomycoides]PDY13620.1 DUF2196 domain-containing protein [Bacillus pseudomycoides]PEB43601.1 DUF2196 domain-containing protein [Bacillus pseudomycoides]